jgi:hypothetical protein
VDYFKGLWIGEAFPMPLIGYFTSDVDRLTNTSYLPSTLELIKRETQESDRLGLKWQFHYRLNLFLEKAAEVCSQLGMPILHSELGRPTDPVTSTSRQTSACGPMSVKDRVQSTMICKFSRTIARQEE